jgi:uncharacterized protein YceK
MSEPMPQSVRLFLSVFIFFTVGLAGCGTIRMMPSVGTARAPKIYSGTRLDLHAISGSREPLKRFGATPPEYPWVDLPFSFLLDTLILPATFPIASYEFLFGA